MNGNFPIPLSEKALVPKDAYVLTDAFVQSPENMFLVEVRLYWVEVSLYWERFPSLLRKLLLIGLFDFHGGWDPWDDWDDDVDWILLNFNVMIALFSASVMAFRKSFLPLIHTTLPIYFLGLCLCLNYSYSLLPKWLAKKFCGILFQEERPGFLECCCPSLFLIPLLSLHSCVYCRTQNWMLVQLAVRFDQYILTSRVSIKFCGTTTSDSSTVYHTLLRGPIIFSIFVCNFLKVSSRATSLFFLIL